MCKKTIRGCPGEVFHPNPKNFKFNSNPKVFGFQSQSQNLNRIPHNPKKSLGSQSQKYPYEESLKSGKREKS